MGVPGSNSGRPHARLASLAPFTLYSREVWAQCEKGATFLGRSHRGLRSVGRVSGTGVAAHSGCWGGKCPGRTDGWVWVGGWRVPRGSSGLHEFTPAPGVWAGSGVWTRRL